MALTPYQEYAVMVLCANDVDVIWHDLGDPLKTGNPTLPAANAANYAYVTSEYWTALAQLRCDDLFISKGLNVYYGLVLRCNKAVGPCSPGDYLVAVRGTMDYLEWANDAIALFKVAAPVGWQGSVGDGFWAVYQSMTLNDLNGGPGQAQPAQVIAAMVKETPGKVFLTGHSLGAALSTYLAADLQAALSPDTIFYPYFFASPKTGTQDFVDDYQGKVTYYTLVNYSIDLVPAVPPALLGFCDLNGGGPTHDVHTLPRLAPGALVPATIPNNHSPIGYALMLDPQNAQARQLLPVGTAINP